MGILARLVVLLPLALSIVGIVLSSLCLFSGHNEGFMEDYDIVRLNTSKIGQDLIPWDKLDIGNIIDNLKQRDLVDTLKDKWDDIKDDAKDKLNELGDDARGKADNLTNGVIEQVTERLGISDWYSLHIMSACHGSWEPNATVSDPSLNVTNCTDTAPKRRFNLTEMLDEQLAISDLGIRLSDIDWPPEIQEKINLINDLLLAIFILYVVGMGFCGLAILGCIGSLILASSRLLVLANFVLSGLGALALTIGSIVVTVVGTKGISELNRVARKANVHASRGQNFLVVSWVAAGCMILAAVFWTTRFCVLCVQKRRDKKMAHRCCQLIRVEEATFGDVVLRQRFGHVPKPNDTMIEQIMGVYSEDSIHASIIFSQFPKSQTRQALQARAFTTAPQSWSVYLSQRKRWALGSKSNELVMIFRPGILWIERLCSLITIITWWIGPFVVAAIVTLIVVFVKLGAKLFHNKLFVGLISVLLFRYLYSFMIVTWLPHTPMARVRFIIGFFIYLVASPFMNMIILVYALLHCDEFSWGKTRAVSDEESGDGAGIDGGQKPGGHGGGPSSH